MIKWKETKDKMFWGNTFAGEAHRVGEAEGTDRAIFSAIVPYAGYARGPRSLYL